MPTVPAVITRRRRSRGRRPGRVVAVGYVVVTAAAALLDGRFGRRAALRGFLSSGLAAAAVVALRAALRRFVPGLPRPDLTTAVAVGFASGVVQETPVGAGLLPLAAVAATGDVTTGRATTGAVAGGALAGAGLAAATRAFWPVAPREAAGIRRTRTPVGTEPSPRGKGLTIVVNPLAGPALSANPADVLCEGLPEARVIELMEGDDLPAVLDEAAQDALALGVAGGDGTINTGAEAALRHGRPLLVVPGGTLNHFARDLGLERVEDAVAAVQNGQAVAVDVATIAGRAFLNTASFGSYVDLVDARERLEETIGKWPAVLVALVRVLRRSEPVDVEIDGRRRRIWMIFFGNCCYHPAGFAPSWRERLDDGRLDVRLVDGSAPLARTRLLFAVLTGRLGRSRVYEQRTATRVEVRSLNGPLRLARDGETFDGPAEFVVEKAGQALPVFLPRADVDVRPS